MKPCKINHNRDRYYPDHQTRKVFNDILGFRAFVTNLVGKTMREKYESGLIKNDVEFKEVFENVLSCCKG